MTYIIKMRRNPNITEAEINCRLTNCYDLLLGLAERSRDESVKSDRESEPEDLDSHLKTNCSESARDTLDIQYEQRLDGHFAK